MRRPQSHSANASLRILLFFVALVITAATSEAEARTCERLFKPVQKKIPRGSRSNESISTPSSIEFYVAHTGTTQLARLDRPQVETLYKIRDRILSEPSKTTRLSAPAEFLLVRQILGHEWKAEDNLSLDAWENRLAIPAFKNLAFKAALERSRFDRITELDDLVQAAMTGLFKAIRRYDANSGFMVSSYIFRNARQEMNEVARTSSMGIDVASTGDTYGKLRSFLSIQERLRTSLTREPSDSEIVDAFNASKAESGLTTLAEVTNILARYNVARAMRLSLLSEPKSGEKLAEGESRDIDAIEFLEAGNPTPEQAYEAKRTAALIAEALKTLVPREELVISLRFGIRAKIEDEVYSLGYSDPLTLAEAGERMGLGPERVRQLEHQARRKLSAMARELRQLHDAIE